MTDFFGMIHGGKDENEILEFLKENTTFVANSCDKNGYTPLFLAEMHDFKRVKNRLCIFFNAPWIFNTRNSLRYDLFSEEGQQFVAKIIDLNDFHAFKTLFCVGNLHFGSEPFTDLVLVSYIAHLGRFEMLKHVLQLRPDQLEAGSQFLTLTPLLAAVRACHGDIVEFLLEKGANKHYATKKGETAFNLATDVEILALLNKSI